MQTRQLFLGVLLGWFTGCGNPEVDPLSSIPSELTAGSAEQPSVSAEEAEDRIKGPAPSPTEVAPCGLSGSYNGDRYYYTIRNCHDYTVKRELDVAAGRDDCTCHTIRGNSQVSSFCFLAPWEHVRGMKSC